MLERKVPRYSGHLKILLNLKLFPPQDTPVIYGVPGQ